MTRSHPLFRFPLSLLLLLSTLAGSQTLHAAETPWYEVEIIVFAQARESYRATEEWKQDLVMPDFTRARVLSAPGAGSRAFQALDVSNSRLQSEWRRLQNSSHYRPLLHTAWRQPGLPKNEAVAVVLETGAASAKLGGAKPLAGVVKVSLSRYLHLDANLLYRTERPASAASDEVDTPLFDTFQLSESRRMRSREIHYLDHPMFGVIALITPL